MSIVESRSISKPPYFDGKNYAEWEKSMMIYIQSVDFKLWLVIKNGPKVPKKTIDGKECEKSEDEYNDEDMKMMEQEAKAKHILCCALNPFDLKRVSSCKTAKEMWDKVENITERLISLKDFLFLLPPSFQRKLKAHESFLKAVSGVQDQAEAAPNTSNAVISEETNVDLEKGVSNLCVSIEKLALEGNWQEAKGMIEKEKKLINAPITTGEFRLLHIAAAANQIEFVKQLLKMLNNSDLELTDINGHTAFCFAAAAGNIKIVDLMLERNDKLLTIRDHKNYTPIQNAALLGRCKMTWHLYDQSVHCFDEKDWKLLFFTCIDAGIYGKYY
ncbi:uncharacterized protein LOC131599609 [Vicia villosa]|uniref:uncharacterized protein LOC131599609 n=1 Tax=Vicia villosa TaxID=3911 RepID=UPI00273B9BD7|nr:uncharacterized protein LOC131599609 [Vicia villosa]